MRHALIRPVDEVRIERPSARHAHETQVVSHAH